MKAGFCLSAAPIAFAMGVVAVLESVPDWIERSLLFVVAAGAGVAGLRALLTVALVRQYIEISHDDITVSTLTGRKRLSRKDGRVVVSPLLDDRFFVVAGGSEATIRDTPAGMELSELHTFMKELLETSG